MSKREQRIISKCLNLLVVCVAIFMIGLFCMFKSMSQTSTREGLIYAYDINRNVTYKVFLKDNNYFEDAYLTEGQTYIADIVDRINATYTYSCRMSKKADFELKYEIVNDVVIKSNSSETKNGELWSKQYTLQEMTTVSAVDQTTFSISPTVSIDYNYYNGEVKKFSEVYGIPTSASMNIKCRVYMTSNINDVDELITEQSVMSLNINLQNDTFDIEKNVKQSDSKNKTVKYLTEVSANKELFVLGLFIVIESSLGIVYLGTRLRKHHNKNYYKIKIERILNKYEDRIARVVQKPEIEDKQIIDTKNLEQLLEIEDELRIPILYYETILNEECEFIIIHDNLVYRYVINNKKVEDDN